MTDFDRACAEFTAAMRNVANWKHMFHGSVFSTRLRSAIKEAKIAIDRMEKTLDKDEGK